MNAPDSANAPLQNSPAEPSGSSGDASGAGASATAADPAKLGLLQRLRFLAKDATLYGLAAALNKSFALITFPLLARHFSVGDYGVIDFFTIIITTLTVLFTFGQDGAIARFFFDHEDEGRRRQLISQSLCWQMLTVVVCLPLLWLLADRYGPLLIDTPDAGRVFPLLILNLPFGIFCYFAQSLLRNTFERTRFLIFSIGSVVVKVVFLVAGVAIFDVSIYGVFLITLLVNLLFCGLGFVYIRRWLVRPQTPYILKALLCYAAPLGVVNTLGALVPAVERSFISHLLTLEDLGLYAAGTKVAMLINLLVMSFQTAWGPFYLSIHKDPKAEATYNLVLKIFTLGVCLAACALTTGADWILNFLASERYAGAAVVIFPLLAALVVQSVSWITEIGISLSRKSYLTFYPYAVYLAATAGGMILCARWYGLFGISLGILLGQLVKAVTASALAQRAYPLPWAYGRVIVLLALFLGQGFFCARLAEGWPPFWRIALQSGGGALLIPAAWFFLFTQMERERILFRIGNLRRKFFPARPAA